MLPCIDQEIQVKFIVHAGTGAAMLALVAFSVPTKAAAETVASVIFDTKVASYSKDPESYRLPGFQLGGEAGISDEGWSLGHSELAISGSIGNYLEAKFTGVMHHHEGEIEIGLEELWFQSVGLGKGFTLKAGRFFSDLGYLNNKHPHAWDFADEPLVYRAMLGMQYNDDGIQASWIAPTDLFWRVGGEAFRGDRYPFRRKEGDSVNSWVLYTDIGGDIDDSQSWQLGLSYLRGNSSMREAGHGHHEGEDEEEHTPAFTGDTGLTVLDFVYKWAPDGNYKNRSFVFQMEYFDQRENGRIDMVHNDEIEESSDYRGRGRGAYLQGVYKFHPQWKAGLRYDMLFSSNQGDEDILEETGLTGNHDPSRATAMVAWVPNEYTTVRLQYNHDRSRPETDHQGYIQFVYSFGPHGAHQF